VQILGGHWAVLQSVAWAQMLVDYAQRDSLSTAVVKTFDGAHPCELCHTVKEGRLEEQKKLPATTIAKLDAILAPVVQLPPRPETPRLFFPVARQPREVARSPLTPPPRLA
jgi:hypothetical protein